MGVVLSLVDSCVNSEPVDTIRIEITKGTTVPRFSDLETAIAKNDDAGRQTYAKEGDRFYGMLQGVIANYSFAQSTDLGSDWWLGRIRIKIRSMQAYDENLLNPDTMRRLDSAQKFVRIGDLANSLHALDTFKQVIDSLDSHARHADTVYTMVIADIDFRRPSGETLILYRQNVAEAARFQRIAEDKYAQLPLTVRVSFEQWMGEYMGKSLLPSALSEGLTENYDGILGRTLLEGMFRRGMK